MQDSMAQQKRHAPDFGPKQLKMKRGSIRVRIGGCFTTLVWKDRQEVYMLTNIETTKSRTFLWKQHLYHETSHYGIIQLAHVLHRQFW